MSRFLISKGDLSSMENNVASSLMLDLRERNVSLFSALIFAPMSALIILSNYHLFTPHSAR